MTYVFTTKTREIWPAAHVAALALVPVSAAGAHRQPCRAAAAQLAVLLLKPQRDELTIPPRRIFNTATRIAARFPLASACRGTARAAYFITPALSSACCSLCRAPPCCFPLLLLQPHRASLSPFSRRATCESRRRALYSSMPPASRWQPLPPRFMPALPLHARAVLLFRRAPGNSMPCRRAAVLVASDLCEPPRYFHIPSPPAAAHVITCELRRERL